MFQPIVIDKYGKSDYNTIKYDHDKKRRAVDHWAFFAHDHFVGVT